MKALSRRGLLGMAGAGLMLPRILQAASTNHRKFLFIYVQGGWDPTWVFAPIFGSPNIWIDPSAREAQAGGIPFTDADTRPSVRSFFERYASKTAILNGLEVRSVTHERCRRLLMTGTSGTADDWPATLASTTEYRLPYLVLSGPAYTDQLTSSVVRVGASGQLAPLIDGTALGLNEPIEPLPSPTAEAAMQDFLASRVQGFSAPSGQPSRFRTAYQTSLDQSLLIADMAGMLAQTSVSNSFTPVSERVEPALRCFEQDFSRCAMVEHAGLYDLGWDTHSGLDMQSTHFELLFSDLIAIVEQLEQRTGPQGGALLEEVTVVVVSEMGRTPTLNTTGGKDHWTFTSAMLIGSGIRGGQVIGSFDSTLAGTPIDLQTGEPGDTLMTTTELGATLLALGDVDPGAAMPIEAVLA